ncbi:uncharacterized protein SPAPADRAFT_139052 [Spathaspora passalidarum NRRL Y-27907]|uniref:Protein HIR n=1 Tax=Spathaspora passalidarum (strain NRRL Y-27907 / 11-Y1) TaxID=619300 RepID=G3APR8_SPAPN|nr:uncharacterized protein SPAPADRAFT_139052 [Spathaspora passalidarum NRRL Y-27907]EGW32239.1 hypothetical protein SPAPADRAFT_139052 [Spathaspora passalidarum NRRL Y-27907]
MKLLQFPLGHFNTVSVSPDNTKLIAGGDSVLQVYDMNGLIKYAQLDPAPKLDDLKTIKPVRTITCHKDAVNCVQFFHNSEEFISADTAGYIYHHTSSSAVQIYPFGSKTAVAIVDLSISADDKILAWSTTSGEVNLYSFPSHKYQRLTSSSSIQRSVSFDPTNNYLVTIGDDTLIHVYQYTQSPYKFRHISKISRLLNKNRRNVKYKRISWSPEGELVAVPTACKNQTMVISLISHTNNWNTSISLVGHDSTCQVVKFNPKLYGEDDSVYSVVASGDGDGTVCVWNTTKDSPIIILKNVGDDIKDLCWVGSNAVVWCGGNGIYVGKFEQSELGDEVDVKAFERLMSLQKSLVKDITHKYDENYKRGAKEIDYIEEVNGIDIRHEEKEVKVDVEPTSVVPTDSESSNVKGKITPSVLLPPDPTATPPPTDILDSAMSTRKSPAKTKSTKPAPSAQPIITMKNGKRRIQPMLISSNNSTPVLDHKTTTNTSAQKPVTSMEFDKPSTVISTDHVKKRPNQDQQQPSKKRQQLEPIKFIGTPIVNPSTAISQIRLATPKIRLHFQSKSGELTLDIKNGSGNETQPSRVTCIKKEKPVWTDFLAKHVGLVTSGNDFFAIALADGNIIIYSQISGIRVFPTLVLGSPISFLESCENYLMAVTNIGELFVWDISNKKSVLTSTITPLLDLGKYDDDGLSKSDHITLCAITTTGIPLITLSNGNGYMYNTSLAIWQTVSESWWCFGSHYWNSATTTTPTDSIIDMLEHHTNEEILRKTRTGRGKLFNKISKNMIMKEGFESLENTISINHLENRIKCAEILGEKQEFKKWFMIYVERLCELGLKVRLFEVCSELLGPNESQGNGSKEIAIMNNGNTTSSEWNPNICGWDKHTLLKDIITTCSIHRDAQRVLIHFGELLALV